MAPVSGHTACGITSGADRIGFDELGREGPKPLTHKKQLLEAIAAEPCTGRAAKIARSGVA